MRSRGAGEAERTRVGQNRRVQAGCDFRRNLHSGLARQAEDHFGSGAGIGINPVHVGEGTRRGVVVDVDEVVLLQAGEPGAGYAIALQDDGGLGVGRLLGVAQHRVGKGQRAVDAGNTVAQDHARLLAHAAQNLAAGQRRADGIAVGPRMRGQNKRLSSPDLIQYFVQHGR